VKEHLYILWFFCIFSAMQASENSYFDCIKGAQKLQPAFKQPAFKQIEACENNALIITNFSDMADGTKYLYFRALASDMHENKRPQEAKPVLLCPNIQYKKTEASHQCVEVEHYSQDRMCNDVYNNTVIYNESQNQDNRLLVHSSLVLYLLHKEALTIVPDIGETISLDNSRKKHKEELSFMLCDRKKNNKAPVFVFVEEDIIISGKKLDLITAFKNSDVEAFLNCLSEDQGVSGTGDKRKFSFPSLSIIAIPFILIMGYFLYKKLN